MHGFRVYQRNPADLQKPHPEEGVEGGQRAAEPAPNDSFQGGLVGPCPGPRAVGPQGQGRASKGIIPLLDGYLPLY